MAEKKPLTIVILSAGKGTRMKSDLAKVLHKVSDRPMLEYVLDIAEKMRPDKTVVVVGHQAEKVKKVVGARGDCALQEPQLGTGHAVMCAREHLENTGGTMILLYGDVPLITDTTVKKLLEEHNRGRYAGTVLTAVLEDPTGYGRIIRNNDETLAEIVEHKDASEQEREVNEINTGICCFEVADLLPVLDKLSNKNSQGEYYITDAAKILNSEGKSVGAVTAVNPVEVEGINTLEQLARAEQIMKSGKTD